jgi:hypothetical protein
MAKKLKDQASVIMYGPSTAKEKKNCCLSSSNTQLIQLQPPANLSKTSH